MSDAHAHMNDPDAPDTIKIIIEVGEDGVLKVHAFAPDENAVAAALAAALATVKNVDGEQVLH